MRPAVRADEQAVGREGLAPPAARPQADAASVPAPTLGFTRRPILSEPRATALTIGTSTHAKQLWRLRIFAGISAGCPPRLYQRSNSPNPLFLPGLALFRTLRVAHPCSPACCPNLALFCTTCLWHTAVRRMSSPPRRQPKFFLPATDPVSAEPRHRRAVALGRAGHSRAACPATADFTLRTPIDASPSILPPDHHPKSLRPSVRSNNLSCLVHYILQQDTRAASRE
jgi:hypothetical protein